MIAITQVPSPRMAECELTHVTRQRIDWPRAVQQHHDYCEMLRDAGAMVLTLEANKDFPDGVFIEDTAVVLDELAVMASMGALSRRSEPAAVEAELRGYRKILRLEPPATLEGGDVLRVGRELFVGLSSRTNEAGVKALAQIVGDYGYSIRTVPVRGALHLKTACTALPDGALLVNRDWVDVGAFAGLEIIPVPDTEPWAANVALLANHVCLASGNSRTAELIHRRGFDVRTTDLSEFAKAEGGVTCLSLLFD